MTASMAKLAVAAIVLFAVVVAAAGFYHRAYPTISHRYRLTVEVETPDGVKSGSSVIEAGAEKVQPILTDRNAIPFFKGDAVYIDLGHGKNLVALLVGGEKAQDPDLFKIMAVKAFKAGNCTTNMCSWKNIAEMSGEHVLKPELLPTFVTVGDVTHSESVREVMPREFTSIFGPAYKLKRVWIELTDAPVTRGLEQHLPFLVSEKVALKRSGHNTLGAPYVPRYGHFIAGAQ